MVAIAWLMVAAVTSLPYATAALRPPPGTAFTGALFYRDDFFQYLSFAEQAERGAFLFTNKFDPEPHPPALVNLEWWAAGRLAALLGGRTVLAFHVLRVLAIGALLMGAARLLALAGLEGSRLVWALALVATGGGLGWLRLLQGTPSWKVPDLLMGLYPWHQSLFNTHFVVGTALLLWALLLHLLWRAGRASRWPWIVAAWALGLSRPYDLAALLAVTVGLVLWDVARDRRWRAGRSLLDLLWLAPLLAYYALVVGSHPSFAGWKTQAIDLSPPRHEFILALGPAALLVLAWGRRPSATPEQAAVRRALAVWCGALAALLVVFTDPMAKQCATSLGAALLLWAASVVPARWLAPATLVLAPTSGLLLWLAFNPSPDSFAPTDYFAATRLLAPSCAPREIAVAPTDLSLLIAGLTPCSVVLGHRLLTPRFADEVGEGNRFYYDASTDPWWRLAYLERKGAAFVLLPAGKGSWLGAQAPFERILARPLLEVWRRFMPRTRPGYAEGAR